MGQDQKGVRKNAFCIGWAFAIVYKREMYEHVAELVYAYVSEAYGVILGSSSLPVLTANICFL